METVIFRGLKVCEDNSFSMLIFFFFLTLKEIVTCVVLGFVPETQD
uniref:Uncharacterized protein n=1 Tax=Anguilla anguilla TaxID=7936 RepID=A0A0E9WED0_ANGAN